MVKRHPEFWIWEFDMPCHVPTKSRVCVGTRHAVSFILRIMLQKRLISPYTASIAGVTPVNCNASAK
jgi:hypothetical protein